MISEVTYLLEAVTHTRSILRFHFHKCFISYVSYVSKSERHSWRRISREYVWPYAILRDGGEFVFVADDGDFIYFIYVDSERGADNSTRQERQKKAR